MKKRVKILQSREEQSRLSPNISAKNTKTTTKTHTNKKKTHKKTGDTEANKQNNFSTTAH